MSKEVVLDIETYGDIKDYNSMKITVVSIYQYENNKYRSFDEHNLGDLWPILERSGRIIGYNSEHFDLPILNKVYPGDLTRFPQLDLLKIIKESCGKRFKLDDIAKATLQKQKSANGLQAHKWYEEGKIDEIKKYCEQDVLVTKEIYEFGKKNKILYYPTLTGGVLPIVVNFDPIDTVSKSNDCGSGINMTLPF